MVDEYMDGEEEISVDEMTTYERSIMIGWINETVRRRGIDAKYPEEMIPHTGLFAKRGYEKLACGLLCLEKSSRLAVFGFCVSNPWRRGRVTAQAVKMILAEMPEYARSKGAVALMSVFGRISLNRELDDMGYTHMELAETKLLKL